MANASEPSHAWLVNSASDPSQCVTGSSKPTSDNGKRPGLTTEQQRRIAELERENRELRRANEILKAASAFLARELDSRPPRS